MNETMRIETTTLADGAVTVATQSVATEKLAKMPDEICLTLSAPTVGALRGATGKNDVRAMLNGWALDCGPDGAHLMATNGYVMVVAPLDLEKADLDALRWWLGGDKAITLDPCTGINLGRGAVRVRIRPRGDGKGDLGAVSLMGTKGPVAGVWFDCEATGFEYVTWRRVDAWSTPDADWVPGTLACGVNVGLMAPVWGGGWGFWVRPDYPGIFRCTLLMGGPNRADEVPKVRVTLMGMHWR